jgi:hypothetical protein
MNMKALPLLMAFLMACTGPALADEVDDILALKAKNRDRIKTYSAEYVVETELPKGKAKGLLNPWKTEIDVLEPYALSMKVEGERVWLKKGNDWTEQEMTPQMHEQFTGMGERFLGPIRPNRGSTLELRWCVTTGTCSGRTPGRWCMSRRGRRGCLPGWKRTWIRKALRLRRACMTSPAGRP